MLKIKNGFLLTLLSCFLLFSCNFNLSKTNKSKTIPLSIQLPDGAKPSILIEDNGRYALPTVSDKIWYKAVLLDSSNKELSAANTQTSTVNISMPSGVGTCKVKVSGYLGNIGDESKIILEGITEEFTKETKELSVEVKPLKTGTGSVNLKIDIADGVGIQTCRINSSKFSEESLTKNNNTFVFSKNSISSGFYDVSFSFYSDTECKNLVYWFPETINIFDNLETNTWLLGQSNPINGGSGTIKITQDLLNNFKKTDITDFYVGTNSNDNQDGDFFNPYDTIQKAVNHIFDINDGSSEYTIYLKNDVKHEEDGFQVDIYNVDDISKPVNIKITSYGTGKKYKIFSDVDNESKSLVNVVGYASLTLSNLILENNNSPSVGCTFIFSEGGTFNFNNVDFQTISDAPLQKDGAITVYDYYVNGVLKKTAGITINECSFFNGDYSSYSNIAYRSFGDITFSGSNSIIKIFTNSPITLGKDFSISNNVLVVLSEHEDSGLLWYQEGKTVLKQGTNGPNISDVYTKFELDSSDYEIGSDGKLKQKTARISLSTAESFDAANVYTISTPEELVLLSDWVNGTNGKTANNMAGITFEVTKPIDMAEIEKFTPIGIYGTNKYQFQGTFDGKEYIIKNLNVSTNNSYAGLFGYVQNGVIKNVRLEGKVKGSDSVGGLIGYYKNYTESNPIDNCIVKVDVSDLNSGSGTGYGGIIGKFDGKYITISNCIFTGSVKANNYVGGIVGNNTNVYSTLKNCINFGNIVAQSSDKSCGGLQAVIPNNGKVKYSYNAGIVSNGYALFKSVGTSTSILYVYYIDGTAADAWNSNPQSISASGIKDKNQSALDTIKVNYAWDDKTLSYDGLDYPVFADIPTELMPDVLSNESMALKDITSAAQLEIGKTYTIGTKEELVQLSEYVNAGSSMKDITFELLNSILLSDSSTLPIGKSETTPFNGTFDGKGFEITGINISSSETSACGLFGYILKEGTVQNLYIEGDIKGTSVVGGLVGKLDGLSSIKNCVTNIHVTGTGTKIGGIAALADNSTIENCVNLGTIYGGTNTAVSEAGGIVGNSAGSEIKNSVNLGEILANANCGGIVGSITGTTETTIQNCYNGGFVYSISETSRGAICGTKKSDISSISNITNTYWLSETCTQSCAESSIAEQDADATKKSSVSDLSVMSFGNTFNGYPVPVMIDNVNQRNHTITRTISDTFTDNSIYTIASKEDFYQFISIMGNKYSSVNTYSLLFVLSSNLIFSESDASIYPICGNYVSGNIQDPFIFTFDGAAHCLLNLKITAESPGYLYYRGLFGCVGTNGVIKNLSIKASYEVTSYYHGGIAGYLKGGVIQNCIVDASFSNNSLTISLENIGGIVGQCDGGTIQNCICIHLEAEGKNHGGIVSDFKSGTVENCVNFADLSTLTNSGSIAYNTTPSFKNCYNACENNLKSYFKTNYSLTLTNCYSVSSDSSVTSVPNTQAGISSMIFDSGVFPYTFVSNGISYPVPVAVRSEFSSSFISTATAESSSSHRELSSEYVEVSSYSAGTIPSSGAKLKVTSFSDIAKINDWVYASSNASSLEGVEFVLTEDIDYKGNSLISPVNATDSTTGFKGTFDGNGYAIKNVVFDVKSTGLHGAGLISVAGEGAVIKNVKLENVTFGSTSSTRLGGIVGHVTGTDVLIENCEVNLQIEKNNGRLGGLVGSVSANATVTIRNCITTGSITGTNSIGGLVGGETTNGRVIIENSASYCDLVHSSGYTGGLVSCTQSTKAKIKNAFFGGKITRPTGDSSRYNPIAYKIANSADGTAVSFVNIFYDESSVSGSMSNELPSDISFQSVSTSSSKYYIGGDSSQDLLETLNAWVTTQNESSPGTYKLWKYDLNGKLVFQ